MFMHFTCKYSIFMLFCLLLDLPSFIETLHSAAAGLNQHQERTLQVGWQILLFHYKRSVEDTELVHQCWKQNTTHYFEQLINYYKVTQTLIFVWETLRPLTTQVWLSITFVSSRSSLECATWFKLWLHCTSGPDA